MERKTVITNALNEEIVLSKHFLFEWKCEEKKKVGRKVILDFSRDDSVDYYPALVELEKEYGNYKIHSPVLSYIFVGLAFVLLTLFFVLFIMDRVHLLVYLFSILAPALAFLMASAILTIMTALNAKKIVEEKPDKDAVFASKIKSLKEIE